MAAHSPATPTTPRMRSCSQRKSGAWTCRRIRVAFTSYFNAGVRAWDIRDPQGAVEAGFYVPAAPNNTYMTNNVEVDNRGYIIIVDRIGNGMDILKLTGKARSIGLGKHGDDDDDDGDDD